MITRWFVGMAALGMALVVGAAPAAAQQVGEREEVEAAKDPPGSFSIGLALGTSPLASGSDTNEAFGHSGATLRVAPSLATRWGDFGLFGATLRLDADDGLYELGVPLAAHVSVGREGWLDVELTMSVGFDHLGVAMLMGTPGAFARSSQRTSHAHLGLRRGRLSFGVAAGAKHYTARHEELLDLERRWTFTRAYLSWQLSPRVDVSLSSQAQWWEVTEPSDLMQSGDRSLTHGLSVGLDVTDEVTLRARAGARQDGQGRAHRPFAGVEASWSPVLGEERQRRAAPSAEEDEAE